MSLRAFLAMCVPAFISKWRSGLRMSALRCNCSDCMGHGGMPEMAELWKKLQTSYRDGTINKKDAELYKKWGAALKKLAQDPHYPVRFMLKTEGEIWHEGRS